MSDPWDVLRRFSNPELVDLSERLDTGLSDGEIETVKRLIRAYDYLRVKFYFALPCLGLVALPLNMGAIVMPLEFPRYPAFALTYTVAVLCWDLAVILCYNPVIFKRSMEILKTVIDVGKPVLLPYFNRETLVVILPGFPSLLGSLAPLVRPKYFLHDSIVETVALLIALHAQVLAPFVVYLTLKLTGTPVMLPYCSRFATRRCRSEVSRATVELWREARELGALLYCRLLTVPMIAVIVDALLLTLLARSLNAGHSPRCLESFARMAPTVTLGAIPVTTLTVRNLLVRIPPGSRVDTVLSVVNAATLMVLPVLWIVIWFLVSHYRLV